MKLSEAEKELDKLVEQIISYVPQPEMQKTFREKYEAWKE